ncbi:MAG: hypothetical protein F6K65_29385 [Moorea sp. SIO3C2]|nr:hypothetical protein [Moorena sp. SIO3C2]
MRYTRFFLSCLLPLASCLLPIPCSLFPISPPEPHLPTRPKNFLLGYPT